jgi:hypothetical protein
MNLVSRTLIGLAVASVVTAAGIANAQDKMSGKPAKAPAKSTTVKPTAKSSAPKSTKTAKTTKVTAKTTAPAKKAPAAPAPKKHS